jgi:hypothetical protein
LAVAVVVVGLTGASTRPLYAAGFSYVEGQPPVQIRRPPVNWVLAYQRIPGMAYEFTKPSCGTIYVSYDILRGRQEGAAAFEAENAAVLKQQGFTVTALPPTTDGNPQIDLQSPDRSLSMRQIYAVSELDGGEVQVVFTLATAPQFLTQCSKDLEDLRRGADLATGGGPASQPIPSQ